MSAALADVADTTRTRINKISLRLVTDHSFDEPLNTMCWCSSRFECFPVKVSQLDRGHGSLETLVAEFHSGPVDGLVNRIGSYDAEDDWHAAFQSGVRDATRDLVGDVIEVGSLTSNDSTKTNYCVKFARLCESKSE